MSWLGIILVILGIVLAIKFTAFGEVVVCLRQVADDEDLGMAGQGEIGPDYDATDAVLVDRQPVRGCRGGDARSPDDRGRRQMLLADRDATLVATRHRHAKPDLDMQPLQCRTCRRALARS